MNYKYSLRYSYELEDRESGFTKEDAIDNKGLTDGLLAISILLPEDGSYSQQICISANGKEKRPLTQKEIFKAWLMLGLSLHQGGQLKGWQAEYVKAHSEAIRDIMKNHEGNSNDKRRV